MKYHLIVTSSLILILLASCHRSSHPLLDETKFARVYADLARGTGALQTGWSDTLLARHEADSILQRDGVTREQMLATAAWLNQDVTRWKEVSDEIVRAMTDSSQGNARSK